MTRICFIILVSCCLLPNGLHAQRNRDKDSLLQVWYNSTLPDRSRLGAIEMLIDAHYLIPLPDSARYFSQQMYQLASEAASPHFQAQSRYFSGNAYLQLGQYEKARQYLEEALPLWEELDNRKGLSKVYNSLGSINQSLGNPELALAQLEKGMAIDYELGDSASATANLLNIASFFEAQGDILTSLAYNQRALKSSMTYRQQRYEAIAHNNLANNYKFIGDIPSATAQYQEARSIYEATSNSPGLNGVLSNLGLLYLAEEDYPRAQQYMEEALEIAETHQLMEQQAICHANLGEIQMSQKLFPEALETFQQANRLIEKHQLVFMQPYIALSIGEALLYMEQFEESGTYLSNGLANSKVHGRAEDVVNGYLLMSEWLIKQGRWTEARTIALKGYEQATEFDRPSLIGQVAAQLVIIHKHFGNASEALRMYEIQVTLRDSLFNQENTRVLISQEYRYAYEKQAYQDSVQNAAVLALQVEENKRRRTISYLLVVGLAITLLLGFLLWNRYRLTQKQKRMIEQEKMKLDQANLELNTANEKLQELDDFKSHFFTNISHEFRTPLTVIGGMSRQVRQQPERWLDKGTNLIERNAESLLHLINQILDLRKLESSKLSLHLIQDDIVKFLRFQTSSFESLAETREIDLSFRSEVDALAMDFDPDKLGQVQRNLLSNALKFTPEGGSVRMELQRQGEKKLLIRVIDTGIGIPQEKIELIFDRFYQVDGSETREGEGTGIGLSLTRELVYLMKGEISVSSEASKGSVFEVLLPIRQQAPSQAAATFSMVPAEVTMPVLAVPEAEPTTGKELPRLLIIEDNPDIVQYLYACLAGEYELSSAPDGQTGIDMALEQVPDLIITDVMMPHKNGYEVTETLKLDERTSHIPIVMLTAKADQPSRLEGYKRGADAFLAKPFDQEELKIRLAKLREIRQRLIQRYQSDAPLPPSSDPIEATEDAFISKARAAILAKVDDPDYRRDALCEDLGLSKSNLNRKLKALTGESIGHFIRQVRIEYAQTLLVQHRDWQVSEVAYATGFNDPAYFSRVFGEAKGLSPQDWREQH